MAPGGQAEHSLWQMGSSTVADGIPGAAPAGVRAVSNVRYGLGIFSLALVIVGWVGTNFLTGRILADFQSPFFVTFTSGISLQAYFVFFLRRDPLQPGPRAGEPAGKLPPLTTRETALLGLGMFVPYFLSNYFTNMSFGLTSAGSASILASTCGFFTLVIGRVAGVERLTFMKGMAVLISVGGVLVLGLAESVQDDRNRTVGNVFSLVGASLYGCYSVYLKRSSRDESRVSMLKLFAFVGLFTMALTWPAFLVLHYTGLEPFMFPRSLQIWGYLLVNIVFGALIPNYLWNIAFAYTSQMVVAIGISFNIPVTLVLEWWLRGVPVTAYKVGSAACIMLGFLIVNVVEIWPRWDVSLRGATARTR